MADKTVYIHYGAYHFDMDKFNAIKAMHHDSSWMNKPNYGLWACRIDAELGWKDWCEGEEFHTDRLEKHFTFTLKDEAKILTVTCLADVKDYIHRELTSYFNAGSFLYKSYVDFAKVMSEHDGMELIHGDKYFELHDGLFNSWDVDSIVIWNPQILQMT